METFASQPSPTRPKIEGLSAIDRLDMDVCFITYKRKVFRYATELLCPNAATLRRYLLFSSLLPECFAIFAPGYQIRLDPIESINAKMHSVWRQPFFLNDFRLRNGKACDSADSFWLVKITCNVGEMRPKGAVVGHSSDGHLSRCCQDGLWRCQVFDNGLYQYLTSRIER